jgi:hypothetical protein
MGSAMKRSHIILRVVFEVTLGSIPVNEILAKEKTEVS